jgi:6-phospho-3-hexuloisomerase
MDSKATMVDAFHSHTITDATEDQQLFWDLRTNLDTIVKENASLAERLELQQLYPLIYAIQQAKTIFVVASGRSGFAMRSTAMRLMHLGYNVYFVGETTTPAIVEGDLLIVASGSGTTSSIIKATEKSLSMGAKVVAITTNKESILAKLASHVVLIPAAEKQDHSKKISAQYAGSLFEQFLLLLLDAVFQTLWKLSAKPAEELWQKHSNFE